MARCETTDKVTRSLLGWGVVAGPLYVGAGLVQALTRDGFDIGRHDVSLLANGSLGWIQIVTFLLTGLMVVACAIGMRRAARSIWGPLLVATYGAGLVAAGVFRADPAMGFPPGTPEDASPVSWHGALHLVAAGVGFLALIAACFVFAGRLGGRGWAAYSVTTGVVFLAAFAGIASGSGNTWAVAGLWAGIVVAWAWILVTSLRLTRALEG